MIRVHMTSQRMTPPGLINVIHDQRPKIYYDTEASQNVGWTQHGDHSRDPVAALQGE
jgi:hypothetical protein